MPASEEICDKIKSDLKRYWNFWKGDFASSAYGKTIHYTYVYLMKEGFFKPKDKTVALSEMRTFVVSLSPACLPLSNSRVAPQTIYNQFLPASDFYPLLHWWTRLKKG
jgi:hypothetical protein